jgi:hypothetical protein
MYKKKKENYLIGAFPLQAVESVKKIMEVMVGAEDKLVPMIRRLATGDYNSVRDSPVPRPTEFG